MADIIEFDLVLDDGIDVDVGLDAGDAINAARAEAWAVGEKNGVPVTESDPTWNNNAKYYAGRASAEADRAEEANRGIDEMVQVAQESAEEAARQATAAGDSAEEATRQADDAEQSAEDAQRFRNETEVLKDGAEAAASEAATHETHAQASATQAARSADTAETHSLAAGMYADSASGASQRAGTHATNASQSARDAANSAADADTQADRAESEADRAEAAAESVQNAGARATELEYGQAPTAVVVTEDGTKVFVFGIPQGRPGDTGAKGDKGDPFRIFKTYPSVAAMEADAANVPVGEFVMIASNVEDPDNAKMYARTASGFVFITDFSGAQGIKGETGNGIASAVLNNDYTLTLTFTNGSTYTTPSIRGATGETGATGATGQTGATGPKGDTGNGIATAVLNADYTLTLTFTNGTEYTTPSIRGAAGYTPVKGTDYWTESDKREMVTYVAGALIDDTAGDGVTGKTWSADKLTEKFANLDLDIATTAETAQIITMYGT